MFVEDQASTSQAYAKQRRPKGRKSTPGVGRGPPGELFDYISKFCLITARGTIARSKRGPENRPLSTAEQSVTWSLRVPCTCNGAGTAWRHTFECSLGSLSRDPTSAAGGALGALAYPSRPPPTIPPPSRRGESGQEPRHKLRRVSPVIRAQIYNSSAHHTRFVACMAPTRHSSTFAAFADLAELAPSDL